MPFKGKQHLDSEGRPVGEAPENLGVYRESAQSGKIKTMIMPCSRYYDHLSEWQENRDTIHVIAHVGQKIILPETQENSEKTGVGLSGRPTSKVSRIRVEREVPRFERPREADADRFRAIDIRRSIMSAQQNQMEREFRSGIHETVIQGSISVEPKIPEVPNAESTEATAAPAVQASRTRGR